MSSVTNQPKKKATMSVLDQLKEVTTIVADTGDFEGMLSWFKIEKVKIDCGSRSFVTKRLNLDDKCSKNNNFLHSEVCDILISFFKTKSLKAIKV